ncbi:hypothetical protein ACGFNV_44955 [Streptomyces sp. NPDC048751]|uniref:hypothetical protein n=1 Tax=Streptomyces sp. NPDC048751 TaxID=3365591 RepID=UPI00371A9C9B
MPRGRHRHSPPLHRLLPPSAIAGVSVVCALAPWVFTEPMVLRGLAAAAAVTAVIGAVVMRHWDAQAGKQVADLTRARASDEWRYEERVAELETDLEESRELRAKLEQRLRAKRGELAGLRNEHAALLRRYATAETERASALEGRRLLEIESGAPTTAHALPPGAEKADGTADEKPDEKLEAVDEKAVAAEAAEGKPVASVIFSPEGAKLFLRAAAALSRFDGATAPKDEDSAKEELAKAPAARSATADKAAGETEAAQEDEARGQSEAVDGHTRAAAISTEAAKSEAPAPAVEAAVEETAEETAAETAEGSAATSVPPATQRPSGHYAVPTAVAVVPAAPVRRPAIGGGFDFFGTKTSTASDALEAVQNEDLADVVGQEALALHKADAEAEFKPADEQSRGIGQVIDLTAHDETEQIDLQGLRSAVS